MLLCFCCCFNCENKIRQPGKCLVIQKQNCKLGPRINLFTKHHPMPSLQFKQAEYLWGEGLKIKYERLKRGWRQEDLAEKCDCQKSQICAIEHGKSINKLTELKICFALGKEPWEICRVHKNWRRLKALTDKMQKDFRRKRAAERRRLKGKKKSIR